MVSSQETALSEDFCNSTTFISLLAYYNVWWQQGGSKFSLSSTPQTIVNKGIPKDWWQSGSKKRKNIFLRRRSILFVFMCKDYLFDL